MDLQDLIIFKLKIIVYCILEYFDSFFKIEKCDYLVGFVNENRNHWSLVVINLKTLISITSTQWEKVKISINYFTKFGGIKKIFF